jgi:translation initiation factor 2 subunit 1
MKRGLPERNELVVCRVTKIYPNSVTAELVEYGKPGMIHVSEVASRWVRDIREFLKEGQFVVCRVIDVSGGQVQLSVKRARTEDKASKMNEFKRENKAEKLLEMAAKQMGRTLEQAYQDVGFSLQDQFGSLTKAFDFAVRRPELLKEKGIPEAWIGPLMDIARKSSSEKEYQVVATLDMRCYSSDGVERIRKALSGAAKEGLEVKYISAPRYTIIGRGKNFKETKARVQQAVEAVRKEMAGHKGVCEFQITED